MMKSGYAPKKPTYNIKTDRKNLKTFKFAIILESLSFVLEDSRKLMDQKMR